MDNNIKWSNEKRIYKTIDALQKNNMNGYCVESEEELIAKINQIVPEGATVSCGGSVTLNSTNVIEHLKTGRFNFLDRDKEGITVEEKNKICREVFFADAYFTSTNAITEDGELYNVDGNGNRVAAMLFGPEKVIVVCGVNKIVADVEEAINRNRRFSAPRNAMRLDRKTPCKQLGYCTDCNSEERICNEYTLIRRQNNKDRIHVIFLNEELGY